MNTWLFQEVLKLYTKELPAMNYAADTGKQSMFLERCVSNGYSDSLSPTFFLCLCLFQDMLCFLSHLQYSGQWNCVWLFCRKYSTLLLKYNSTEGSGLPGEVSLIFFFSFVICLLVYYWDLVFFLVSNYFDPLGFTNYPIYIDSTDCLIEISKKIKIIDILKDEKSSVS